MLRRLTILLLIVGCEDIGTNTTTCMEELQVESYSELAELYEEAQSDYDNIDLSIGNYTAADVNRITQVRADIYNCNEESTCPPLTQ